MTSPAPSQQNPGLAPAAGPPAASAIHTPSDGLETGFLDIPARGAELPLYFARLPGAARAPVVLVAAEIFGLHEHIRDICRRLAREGYFAIAPDYFAAYGDPLNAPDIAAIRAIVASVPDAEALADFDAALAFAAQEGGDPSHAAITGFCWGGRMAWLYAARTPALKACIPWYGRLDGEHSDNQSLWPMDVAASLEVPYLALYGGADPSIPPEVVDAMRAKLAGAPAGGEITVYDGAPHAFFADYRDSYRADAAQDAWGKALAFLKARFAAA